MNKKILKRTAVAALAALMVAPCALQVFANADGIEWEQTKEPAVTYYVSPTGSGDGSSAEKPASLASVNETIASLETLPSGGITVYMLDGMYIQHETLEFTVSGTADCPITYKAYEGANPVIQGGYVLKSSDFVKGDKNTDAMVARIKDATAQEKVIVYDLSPIAGEIDRSKDADGNPQIEKLALFYDNERGHLARYPNYDPEHHTGFMFGMVGISGNSFVDERVDMGSAVHPNYSVESNIVKSWKYNGVVETDGVIIHGNFDADWSSNKVYMTGYNESSNRVSTSGNLGNGNRYYFSNSIYELDTVGEYYIDMANEKLYFYPPENYENVSIVLSHCPDYLVRAEDISYYTFEGITFEGAFNDTVKMTGDHLTLRNCNIYGGDGTGLDMNGMYLTVYGCDIAHIGGTAVKFEGGNREYQIPSKNLLDNNKIHDFGEVHRVYNPAVALGGVGVTVSHNEIYNTPHTSFTDGSINSYIEYNFFHDICYEGGDAGAVYVGGLTANDTIYRYNYFKDITNDMSIYYSPGCYYSDDGGSGKTVISNIFENVDGGALQFGGGRDNVLKDNILINCGISYDQRLAYRHNPDNANTSWRDMPMWADGVNNGGRFGGQWGNLIPYVMVWVDGKTYYINYDTGYGTKVWDYSYPWTMMIKATNVYMPDEKYTMFAFGGAIIRNNVIIGNGVFDLFTDVKRLTVNRDNMSYSSIGKVGFADPNNGDYTLLEDSVIYRDLPGFKAADFSQIGLRSDWE